MNTLWLSYFKKAAELHSVSKAAYELHVPSSTLSKAIQRTEEYFGCECFERSPGGLALNENGLIVLKSVSEILELEEKALRDLYDLNQPEGAQISISVNAASYLTPQIFSAFQKKHPELRLHLASLPFTLTAMHPSWCDLSLYHSFSGIQDNGYGNSMVLVQEPLMLCVGKSHPLASRKYILPEEYVSEPHVFYSANEQAIENIKAYLAAEGLLPQMIVHTIQQTAVIRRMLSDRNAVAIVPFYDRIYRKDPELVLVPIRSGLAYFNIHLSWRESVCLSSSVYALRDFIVSYFLQLRTREETHGFVFREGRT